MVVKSTRELSKRSIARRIKTTHLDNSSKQMAVERLVGSG
jgi:hypothetical protein